MNADCKVISALVNKLKDIPSVKRAVLFGSRARGDSSDRSDYDVAVYGVLSLYEKAALRYACDNDIPTLHKIDLIFVKDVDSPALLENIDKDGIVIYDGR